MNKKTFALLFAICAILSACMVDEYSGVGDLATTTPAALEFTTPPALELAPERDFGGRTLQIGAWWDLEWENVHYVEQKFNVQIENVYVTYDDFLPSLAVSLTIPRFADVVYVDGRMQMELIGSGTLLPLGENTWTIPQGINDTAFGLGVNLDIINAEAIPNPIDLFEAGEWTWDAMLYIMRRATRDTTGNGIVDQFGIAGQPADIVRNLIGANDGILVCENLNYGFDHINTVTALVFAYKIFAEQLWAHEPGGVMNAGNWSRNFFSGKDEGNAALFSTVSWGLDAAPPAFNFGFVPFPRGPLNTSGNTNLAGLQSGWAATIYTAWKTEDVLLIMNELLSLQPDNSTDWLHEIFPTEADVQRALYAGRTTASDIGMDIPTYYWILGHFASYFHHNEMTVMEAVEYFRQEHQAMLDYLFRWWE
jgi:multiple sugar transport system substrate-binding protein